MYFVVALTMFGLCCIALLLGVAIAQRTDHHVMATPVAKPNQPITDSDYYPLPE